MLFNVINNFTMSPKLIDIPDLKLVQLQYESDSWKRVLAFIRDENIHLKYRLSDVLKNNFDKQLLVQLENFQSNFVKEDDLLAVLRSDLAELDKLLVWEIMNDEKLMANVENKMKAIRCNIHNAEKQFNQLKADFISYLTENM